MRTISVFCLSAVLLTACQTTPEPRVTAELPGTGGSRVFGQALGRALFAPAGNNVHVIVYAEGLNPGGLYALRIHDGGECGRDATGDLPPLRADVFGRGVVEATLTTGPAGIVGRSLALHAAPEPQGAGARIACGPITRG